MKKKYIIITVVAIFVGLVSVILGWFLFFNISRIPTSNMANTIIQEDKILVRKVFWTPKRGDIIVFKYPKEQSLQYVKRIVGLPGEKIEIKGEQVLINDKPLPEQILYAKPVIKPDNQFDVKVPMNVIGRGKIVKNALYNVYIQKLGGETVEDLKITGQEYAIESPFFIPKDSYFVLGDNRDYSQDSRYWGPVKEDLLVGKVIGIYRTSLDQWVDVK